MTARVSIVVPSRTGNIDALRSQLAAQSFVDWDLIVQANTSPPSRARNLGAARAKAEFLIFLDDDIRFPHADALADLVLELVTLPRTDAVGVLWVAPPAVSRFQRWYMADAFPPLLRNLGPSANLAEVDWMTVGTACFGLSREMFEQLGGFDERFLSGEDYELSYRLTQQGGRVFALTGCRVLHPPPRNLRAAIQKTIWYERGNVQLAKAYPHTHYRIRLRGPWHAAVYLVLRTAMLPLLCVMQLSYHHRKAQIRWRPLGAFLSYIGAWAYCYSWFFPPKTATHEAPGFLNRFSVPIDTSTKKAPHAPH